MEGDKVNKMKRHDRPNLGRKELALAGQRWLSYQRIKRLAHSRSLGIWNFGSFS